MSDINTIVTKKEYNKSLYKLLKNQLIRLHKLISIESKGNAIKPEAYAINNNFVPKVKISIQQKINYEKILSYSRNEPRLEMIKRSIERLISAGNFFADGKILCIDAFRKCNLKNWANFSVGTPEANFPSISSYCNCDCDFCYEKGTRETPIFDRLGRKNLSLKEVKTRFRYYSRKTQNGLIPASYLGLEPFMNPHCLEILERIHSAYPDDSIKITTNGGFLTEDVVIRLSKLKPILVMVSINAGSIDMRQRVMHEKPKEYAQIAMDSFALLKKYKIASEGSYVPWHTKPLSDMIEAVHFMDEYDVIRARICMPSYTKYHGYGDPFDTNEYWQEIISTVKHLRNEVNIPIDIVPNSCEFDTSMPIVHGAVKNSPAHRAGIRFGDLILAIDRENVYTLADMHGRLAQRALNGSYKKTTFTVERDQKIFDVDIPHPEDINNEEYPFCSVGKPGGSRWANSLGIHYTGGFSLTNIVRFLDACKEYMGKKILLLTSELMEPHFKGSLAMVNDASEVIGSVEIYLTNPVHRFWGGNVKIGDLWTIPDLVEHTRDWIDSTDIIPDVVFVSGTFLSVGKKDLLGNCYLEFERNTGIELRLIPCVAIIE